MAARMPAVPAPLRPAPRNTNGKGSCNVQAGVTEFYCLGNNAGAGATKFKDAANGTLVLSVSKTF